MKFEELLPEIQELINKDEETYPHLVGKLKNDIAKSSVTVELTVESAQQLINYLDEAARQGKLKRESDSFVLSLYQVFGK